MHGGNEENHEDTNNKMFLLPRLLSLPYYKTEALGSFKTLTDVYGTTRRYNPENPTLHWGRQVLKKSLKCNCIHSQLWQVSKT
jgi:hypothetical protein